MRRSTGTAGAPMRLAFGGATGTVTGSRYHVTGPGGAVLVDGGLYQGFKQLRLRNWEAPAFHPAAIDAVLLTHAHLDHSGWLPRLVASGFAGPIHSTAVTRDLCEILLPDSARLLEEEAAYANRRGFSKHHPALPLYTTQDAKRCLARFSTVAWHRDLEVAGFTGRFTRAGHLPGAASIRLADARASVVFSGDLGRPDDPLLPAPEPVPDCDFLVVESTYGNRLHDRADPLERLADVIERTARRGGVVVIPAFTVGRAQELLHFLGILRAAGRLPKGLPVFLNSPMASRATRVFTRRAAELRIGAAQVAALGAVAEVVETPEDSKALNARGGPMVIVAGSGMVTGGRVLHHVKAFAPDPRNTLLFVGFQAAGTRGAAIVEGAAEVKIHGEPVPIRCEVESIGTLSAHADADELIAWMRTARRAPRTTFVTHGEPAAADALRRRIETELGWSCRVPAYRDHYELGEGEARRTTRG